jgi:hypothetical protein
MPLNFTVNTIDETRAAVLIDDIQLTDGVTTWNSGAGVSTFVQSVPDNSVIEITVTLAGHITYTNTVTTYTNDVTASVLLQPVITDPSDPNFRRPYPNFFTIIEPCSYRVHLYDGTANPFGVYSYEENSTEFDSGSRNSVFDPCQADILSLDQRIVVRQIPNCGGTSPIIWDVRYSDVGEAGAPISVTVTEYVPQFTPSLAFSCCMTVDEAFNLAPTSIELWDGTIHDACDINTSGSTVLNYTITDPDGNETTVSYTGVAVAAGPLADLDIDFTPTTLGTYTVEVDITNCCETNTYTYSFDACLSWVITNTTCNTLEIQNVGTHVNSTITYDIKRLTDYSTFETVTDIADASGTLAPGATLTIDLVNDNLYTIDISDNYPSTPDKEYIFLLDCNIKKCKKDILLRVLCDSLAECDTLSRQTLLAEFAEFKALEEIVYQKWDEWKAQQTIVDTFSINDIMEDVTTLSKAISSILKICGECETLEDDDCGCS